jgi:hypothetical protein
MDSYVFLQNHRVERLWVEINRWVNYPVKAALIDMTDGDLINMDDDITRFCVSNITQQVFED